MMLQSRKWLPLHVAIAWALTRDLEFCDEIGDDRNAEQRTFCASDLLEQAMMQAGCFVAVEETIPLDPPSRTFVMSRHRLTSGYSGRFKALAEEYDGEGRKSFTSTIKDLLHNTEAAFGIVSVSTFLSGHWHDAFRIIADRIADGEVRARGVAVDGERRLPSADMPAASVTTAMWMDLNGMVWEGPEAKWGEQPRRWIGMTIERDGLRKHFPPHEAPDPESRCQQWLADQMKKSPGQRTKRRSEFKCEALATFEGLRVGQFDRAWVAAIGITGSDAWSAAGRPRKNTQLKSPNKK